MPTHRSKRLIKRAFFWSTFLPLIIVSSILANWAFLAQNAFAASLPTESVSSKMTFQQVLKEGQQLAAKQTPFQRPSNPPGALKPAASSNAKPLPSAEPATMHDMAYTLDDSFVLHRPQMKQSSLAAKIKGAAIPTGTTPYHIKGNDGRLEVVVPRGSLDFTTAHLADGSAPIGQLILQVHQVSGHSIEAESILGTYVIQVVDSQGNVVQGVTLTKPMTIRYHYQNWEMQDLNINPNEVHLAWTDLLATAQTAQQQAAQSKTVSPPQPAGAVISMTNNAKTHTLTAQSSIIAGPLTASSQPVINAPAKPDLFEASGNNGAYNYSYPISVVPGPAGFAPQLALTYSSQGTNERYSRRSPAGDEGDGFSLSLGSITAAQYPATSTGGAGTWYSINGVDGVSDKLVPVAGKAGYYETQHISHLLIQFTGSCWRVWGKDGSYETLGCTADSLQKTPAEGTYEWDVDHILAPYNNPNQVKLMLISYLQDSPSSGTIRDAAIKQIQYGYATSFAATSLSLVAGTINFHYHMPSVPSGQSAFVTAYGTNYHCASAPPSSTTLRCDDPTAYQNAADGTIPAPDVMATMSLDSITSYVGADTANQPAYKYAFTYQDTPFSTGYYDPDTFIQQSAAGEHLLTQITPTVYVQGTPHASKPVVFGYTGPLTDGYNDPNQKAANGSNQFSGQTFWQYLNHYKDLQTGEGANISYKTAYGNMEGTPEATDSQGEVVDDRFDPFFCDNNSTCTGVYGNPSADSWSIQAVTQVSALGTDSSGYTSPGTTYYHYALTAIPAANDPVGCNPVAGSGEGEECVGDAWTSYYSLSTPDHDEDWQDYYHAEFRGFNIVYTTSMANNLTVDYYFTTAGWNTDSWGLNSLGGTLYQEDVYQGDEETPSALLRETLNYYASGATAPANDPYTTLDLCHGLDSPIYNPCLPALMETRTTTYDGQGGSANAPWVDTKYSYDDVGSSGLVAGYHNTTQEVISSSNAPTITKKWTYANTDQEGSPTYYTVDKVSHSEIDDASGHVWSCQDTTYDEGAPSGVPTPDAGLATTTTSYSTCGNNATALTSYTAYDQYGNPVATVDPLAAANPSLYSSKGCSASGVVDLSAAWTAGHFTSCTSYDTSKTANLPVSSTNALGQATSTTYDYTSGAEQSSMVDLNGQTTSYGDSYNGTNETISTSEPGETGSSTTQQSENSTCTSASTPNSLPCYEIDTASSLYPGAVSRTFYDSQGRVAETRTPGPTPGDDTVTVTAYDDANNIVWTSEPLQVSDATYAPGWIDPQGIEGIDGDGPMYAGTFSDALGRVIATQDENYGSTQEPGLSCSPVLSGTYTSCTNYSFGQAVGGDTSYYALTTTVDPNGHVSQSFTDGQGNVRYTQANRGIYGGTLTVSQRVQTHYNALNKPTAVAVFDELPKSGESPTVVNTTMTYDDQGRLLTVSDPDQGTLTYTYDPDGNILTTVQTSGSSTRTLGFNYDLLGRLGCEQTAAPTINATGACSAGNPLVKNTYDVTEIGTQGTNDFPVGHLTRSDGYTYYPDGTSIQVLDSYQFDQRGRPVAQDVSFFDIPSSWNVTSGLPEYKTIQSYNDADQVTTTSTHTYANSTWTSEYTFTNVYDSANGVMQGLSNNDLSTANLGTLAYTERGQVGSITVLNGAASSPVALADEGFYHDNDLRPTGSEADWLPGSGNSGQILNQSRGYDNTGNVTSVSTTFAAVPGLTGSGGSEVQNFCYDEQNRLTWSGNAGTQPGAGNGTCGSGTLASNLTNASYTAPFTYTNLGQIWTGPLNGKGSAQQYLYCNSAPHQLTGIYPSGTTCATIGSATAGYSASYDAWGNETGRTYNGATDTLTYDALNRLTTYSDTRGASEQYVYDASGNRILKRSTSAGTTTLSAYPSSNEEYDYSSTGTLTSQLHYYTLAGHLIASFDGTNTTYYLTDSQGTLLLSFSQSAILGEQIYGPYGNQRYTAGTINTSKGYTGQIQDAVTGLDYYNARYYDPVAGVFLSVDSAQGNMLGFDPYAYVSGNPETMNDPTGHWGWQDIVAITVVAIVVAAVVIAAPIVVPVLVAAAADAVATTAATVSVSLAAGAAASASGAGAAGVVSAVATTAYVASVLGPDAMAAADDGMAALDDTTAALDDASAGCGDGLSFRSNTLVATNHGEQAIGTLQVGEQVWSYNPQTKQMELEPIQKVWLNHDNDLVDMTLVAPTQNSHGKATCTKDAHGKTDKKGAQNKATCTKNEQEQTTEKKEVIHTNERHPFLTEEKGFIPVSQLKPGMHVLEANGSYGVVAKLVIVPGAMWMYNLTVAQNHTYAVGLDQWIVHNDNGCLNSRSSAFRDAKRDAGIPSSQQPDSVRSGTNGVPLTDRDGNPILDANGRRILTREYLFSNEDGSQTVIQEHSAGHNFGEGGIGDQGPHFNVRPIENTRTGIVPGTKGHYPFYNPYYRLLYSLVGGE